MAQNNISVSQLKCAVLDPKWRMDYLSGKNPSTMSFGSAGQMQVFGTRFHSDADKIVAWLLAQPKKIWDSLTADEEKFWHFVHDTFAADFLDDTAAKGKIDEAMAYAERMQTFASRIASLRKRSKSFETWQDVFLGKEFAVSSAAVADDDFHVNLTGKIDAIRFDENHNLEIIDYKLSQGANQMQDMVQLAIYARILELAKPGCQFSGVVEYYLPHFQEVKVSRNDLDKLYLDLVQPVLLEMFGKDGSTVPKTQEIELPVVSKTSSLKQEVADKIKDAYSHFKLQVEVASVTEGPQIFRFNIKPGAGVKVSSLANRAEDLQVALSLLEPPLIKAAKGFVILDIPKPKADVVLLKDFVSTKNASKDSKVSFPVGLDVEGNPLIVDLSDPNTCHGLIAGTSGSGKSELLKAIVASLVVKNTSTSLRLAIVDPKILTFTGVTNSPFLMKPVITDVQAAIELLREAVEEMDKRYRSLAKEGQTSLKERWEAGMKDIPYYVLVFDEFADLILSDRELKKQFEELIVRIAAKGRAAGIHLILATQRPDKNIVTGLIKANLPLKICLRVTSSTNSQIVVDEPGGESLLGRGDLLCDAGRGIVRAQSYFIPQSEFLQLLR